MSLHFGAAAAAIASIRTHTAQRAGCPQWDAAGIAKALQATQGPPGDVLAAAALAASDPKLRLPSEAGFRNHWPKNASAEPRVSYNVPCAEHPDHDMPCKHPDHGGDMTPEQIATAARQARAVIEHVKPAPRRTPPPTDLAALRARADQEKP